MVTAELRREAGRRSREALRRARAAHPMTTEKVGPRSWTIKHSGQERNFWVGQHFAYMEIATAKLGRKALVDG